MSQVLPFALLWPLRQVPSAWVLTAGLAAAGMGIPAVSCQAQVSDVQRQQLVQQVRQLQQNLQPQRLPDLDRSGQRLQQQAAALERFLRARTPAANAQAWLDYLQLDPLLQAIQQDADVRQQGRLAEQLVQRMTRNLPGLNLPAMRGVRQAARELVAAARFSDPETALPLIDRQLNTLAERLEQMEAVPSTDAAAAVSAILSILAPSGQVDPLMHSVRSAFGQPNLRVAAGQSLISRAAYRSVDRQEPLRDCILGTRLVGQSYLRGQVTAHPIESQGAAMIRITLTGNFNSRSIGYNGPVTLDTVGYGNVTASRLLVLDDAGVRLQPTYATVSLDSQILSINHHLRLVRRIAAKRAAQQKSQANMIAADRARARIGGQFANQTDEVAARPLALPLQEARETLGRLGLSAPQRQWASSDAYVQVAARQAEPYQTLAAVPPPPLTTGFDVTVQLHESLVDNVATEVLAGRTMTQQQLQRLLEEVRPQQAQQADLEVDAQEPFEIDFSRLRPVIFEAREGMLRVGIRGTRFSQGGRELQRPMEITAVYQPVEQSGQTVLQRVGEVDVDFPGGGRLSVTQVGLRTNIQRIFSDVFPAQLLDQPIGTNMPALQGATLRPALFSAADGWVSVGLR